MYSASAPKAAPTAQGTTLRLLVPVATVPTWRRAGRSSSAAGMASSGTIRNTQRQPRCCTIRPLMLGPISEGTTQPAEKAANTRGRIGSGKERPTSTYSATEIAPAPRPCISRPSTSTGMCWAKPATSRPATKQARPSHSGRAGPRWSLQRPDSVIPITLVARVPPNASAYRRRPSRSWATVGIAAATASASKPCSETSATMPMVVAR